MRKIWKNAFYVLIWFLIKFELLFAASAGWIMWEEDKTWISKEDVRSWNLHIDDIPVILRNIIDLLLWVAWTITIILIIIWGYKIVYGAATWEKTKWRDTIIMALTWFAISSLAWFIIKFVLDNFWTL